MADTKITALTALTAADPINDVIPIVDVSDTSMAASGTTKKISVNNILSSSPTASGALTVTGLVTAGSATITGDLTVDTSTLKVDSTNNRVGVGTASPASRFEIADSGTAVIFSQTLTGAQRWQQIIDTTLGDFTLRDQTGAIDVLIAKAGTGNVNISTGNVVMGTANKGIDFSINSDASATSELLNDYEEGTFTPTITSGATAVTYSPQYGRYTKVGRLVTVYAQITTTAATRDANQFIIGGLPFSTAVIGSGAIGYSNSGFISTAGGNKPNLYVSGSAVEFYNSAGGSFAGTTIASDAFDIRFSATYFA